jgi:pimeloyl-ACP methyl ester carboxylesterase
VISNAATERGRVRRYFVLFLAFLTVHAWAETGTVMRADGSTITYYLDRPPAESFPIVTILQGSECLKVSHKYGVLIDHLLARGVGALRVEKPGLNDAVPIGECPSDYLRLNTPQRRVLDLVLVLADLRRGDSGFNGSVALTGGSEGAMIAALAAPLCPELRAVVLFSGGGGTIFGDEVLGSVRMQMSESGADQAAIEQRLEQMKLEMEEIREEPLTSKEWLSDGKLARSTHLWWSQAWDLQMSVPLLRVEVPILAWQGENDLSVPAESGRGLAGKMKEAGKSNFELRTYPGGHAPPEKVLIESLDWVLEQFAR